MSQLITGEVTGTISLAPDAEAIKAAALAKAEAFKAPPANNDELAIIADARRGIHDIVKAVGKTYDVLNRPILDKGIELRRLRDDYLASLLKREGELDGYINNFATHQLELQRQQQREAEQAAQRAEQARIAAEKETARLAAEQEATRQREEQAKIDAENARLAIEAANSPQAKAAAEKAAQEAAAREQQAKEDAAKIAAQQQAAEEEAEAAAMTPLPTAPLAISNPKGVSAKAVWDYTIIGEGNDYREQESLAVFSREYPHLVKYTIRRQDVLDRLNGPGFPSKPPGITPYERVKSTVR